MTRYGIRDRIFSYVSPSILLFPATYALVFGTRHGVSQFTADIHKLYVDGYFKKLLISGGITRGGESSEAETMSRQLVARGLPRSIMILEENARNTGENVALSRSRMAGTPVRDLLLIGKISSARRYIMTVRKQWPDIRRICCHRVNYFGCDEKLWWKNGELRERITGEYRKIASYLAAGHIQEVEIVDGVVL